MWDLTAGYDIGKPRHDLAALSRPIVWAEQQARRSRIRHLPALPAIVFPWSSRKYGVVQDVINASQVHGMPHCARGCAHLRALINS